MPGNIGPLEIVLVLIIALVVFGPKRLPELGSSLGRGIREFRSTVSGEKQDEDVKEIEHPRSVPAPVAPAEKPAKPEAVSDKRT